MGRRKGRLPGVWAFAAALAIGGPPGRKQSVTHHRFAIPHSALRIRWADRYGALTRKNRVSPSARLSSEYRPVVRWEAMTS